MEQVKGMIELGATFAGAVKQLLGRSIDDFTSQHGLPRQLFSDMLHGRRVPDERQLAALIATLGGTPQEWLDLWFSCARKRASAIAGAL